MVSVGLIGTTLMYTLPLVIFRYKMSYCKMKVDQIAEFIFLGSTVPRIGFLA